MKRFTETDKWSDKWFRKLSPESKLLFLYLCDNCDIAGFIEKDIELWEFHTGIRGLLGAYKGLVRGLEEKGDVVWIKNFLRHQKNDCINPVNNAHKAILVAIMHHPEFIPCIQDHIGVDIADMLSKLGAYKGLNSPIGIGKGKSIKEEGIVKGRNKPEPKPPPTLEEFKAYCQNELSDYHLEAENIYEGYAVADWHDSNGKKIKNWKQKLRQVWCKPEKKKKSQLTLTPDRQQFLLDLEQCAPPPVPKEDDR